MKKTILVLLALPLAFLLAIVGFVAIKDQGWLSPIGIKSESHDSQVVQAIERTQEVSLLRLGIQGIKDKKTSRKVGGWGIPWTAEQVFLQYNFKAKLGIDGAKVKVTKTGDHAYTIAVPEFIVIGYDEPTFKVAVEESGALSWITPDIDKVEMISEILNDDAKQEYIDSNVDILKEQTKAFYDALVTGVDAEAKVTYEFSS